MLAEMQVMVSVQDPIPRVCCPHLHNAHNNDLKARTPRVLSLHQARFMKTRKILATDVGQKQRRKALCRASWGEKISRFEDVEGGDEVQLDSSVFEEVFPTAQRMKKPVGTRIRGVPIPQSTLIPDDWKDMQRYLERSKKERKEEALARQLDWAKRKAFEERLTQEELKNELRRWREQERVSSGTFVTPEDVLADQVEEDPQTGVETPQHSVSGRARPRDFRSDLHFPSVEEIAQSLGRVEEEAESSPSQTERGSGKEASKDPQGQAPAAGEKKHLLTTEEMAMLKSKDLNFAKISTSNWSPLHTLAAAGQVYLAAQLLKKAVDLDAVDGDGLTPLHRAVQAGRKTMVRMLLRSGANAQVLDSRGATLLHYSAQTGDTNISKLLLAVGVDVNVADADGWTPLHVAVQAGRVDLVKALVHRGANIDIANKDGKTALNLALAFGATFNFYDTIKFLKKMSVLDSEKESAHTEDDDEEVT